MTLQQAKDQVAKEYGYDSWAKLVIQCTHDKTEDFLRPALEYAAELYCLEERRRTWDEACEAMKTTCADQFINSIDARVNQYSAKQYCINAPKPEFKP